MENDLSTRFDDSANAPKRPAFLTTLCILTWVWCGIMLLSTVFGLITNSPEKQREQIEQMRQMYPDAADQMEAALEEQGGAMQIISSAINLVALGLSAFGAWMMWNLKRKGFFIYIVGEILPYSGFFLAGKAMAAAFSAFGGAGGAMIGVVITIMVLADVVFFILYGVNLKHMNK